jgi:phosphoserine phosphatase
MMLGLDFDNTIIRYDELFHKVALEKKVVPGSVPADKNAIRNYLYRQHLEDEWTRLQGEVYGARINEARPFDGMLETLRSLKEAPIRMCIVSHKTRTPYLGPNYDLHQAARDWMTKQGFFDEQGLSWKEGHIFFESTKEEKVRQIVSLGCTHYIDDLPEILKMLPDRITKILFSPKEKIKEQNDWLVFRSWKDLPSLLL